MSRSQTSATGGSGGNGASGGNNGSSGGTTGTGGCSGLTCFQTSCPGSNMTTTVSGRVTAPNGLDPVYDAVVYVPTAVPEFPATVQCETCNEPIGGTPIVTTNTGVDGKFTLMNVPATTQVPIIVQKGRFRRQIVLDITACQDNPLSNDQARLPRNQGEGDLPKMAVAVGDFDQIECVLRSIGIDDKEFTSPSGTGAVHLYDNGGSLGGPGGTEFTSLLNNPAKMADYNLIFINCTANTFDQVPNQTAVVKNIHDYVNTGGRLYVTDWSYDYLEQVPEFSPYIYYAGGGSMTTPQPIHAAATARNTMDFTATVTDTNLVEWLMAANASTNGMVQIQDLLTRWVLMQSTATDQSTYPSESWLHGTTNGADRPLTVTFDYNMCGKVLYSSYHTREPGGSGFSTGLFPGQSIDWSYCKSSPSSMVAQEKVLEYLILQISSCVGPVG